VTELTRQRIAELRRAADGRGDDSEVEWADFSAALVDGLTWDEVRELLDAWETLDRRVG
jgi:hypothetical protein